MNCDMDLARRILLDVEANPEAIGGRCFGLNIEGHEPAKVYYHVLLLKDAGLIEASSEMSNSRDGFVCLPQRLTFAGHEFLDASRKDTIWQKAKAIAVEKTGGFSFEVLKAILIKLATNAALGTGS